LTDARFNEKRKLWDKSTQVNDESALRVIIVYETCKTDDK